MKKACLLILFWSSVLLATAQVKNVPSAVTDAFAARYPHATKVEWHDKAEHFQASFHLNGSHILANFSPGGQWQSSEREVRFDDLCGDVVEGFKKSKYAGWDKKSVQEVQEHGKPIQFRITVYKSNMPKKNLYFNANGKLLREVVAL